MRKFAFFSLVLVMVAIMETLPRKVLAEATGLLNDVQNPIILAENFPLPVSMIKSVQNNLDDSESSNSCHIEYQVTRRRIGHCIKLAQGITGCASGQYLNPFHPDCM